MGGLNKNLFFLNKFLLGWLASVAQLEGQSENDPKFVGLNEKIANRSLNIFACVFIIKKTGVGFEKGRKADMSLKNGNDWP
jgi:hypothetical protein